MIIRLPHPVDDPLKLALMVLYDLLDDACVDGAGTMETTVDDCRCDARAVHNQARVVLGLRIPAES